MSNYVIIEPETNEVIVVNTGANEVFLLNFTDIEKDIPALREWGIEIPDMAELNLADIAIALLGIAADSPEATNIKAAVAQKKAAPSTPGMSYPCYTISEGIVEVVFRRGRTK